MTRRCSRALQLPAATSASRSRAAVNMFDVDVVVLGGCFGPLAPWLADDVGRRVAQARALVGLDGL